MRNIILIVFLVLLRLNSFGQNFFNANFSAETNYDQKNIKQNKIKSLYIKGFSAFINKDNLLKSSHRKNHPTTVIVYWQGYR